MTKDRSKPLYLEDFATGETFRSGSFTVTPELVKEFASFYDPQPMHLDEAAARASLFGELVGSGWQTLAITMRLMVGVGCWAPRRSSGPNSATCGS